MSVHTVIDFWKRLDDFRQGAQENTEILVLAQTLAIELLETLAPQPEEIGLAGAFW